MDTDEEVIHQVVRHDYRAMYEAQLSERRTFLYPPFCRIIYIHLRHRDERAVEQLSQQATALLRQIFDTRLLGPYTPHVAWVQGMHLRQLLLKVERGLSATEVRQRLRMVQQHLLSQPQFAQARFYYDVD